MLANQIRDVLLRLSIFASLNLAKRSMKYKNKKGFTLLEILLVIGIIATLAVVVIVSLNPAQRFEDAQNSRRLSDIQSILSATQQYIIDNKGEIPAGISATEKQISTNSSDCNIVTEACNVTGSGDCVDLTETLSNYLKEMPYDSNGGTSDTTHYSIQITNNIVTVRACDSTDPGIASVSR